MALGGNEFTYYCFDFLSGSFLGALPLFGVSFGSQLNAHGQLTGSLNIDDPRTQFLDVNRLTTTNKVWVGVDYDPTGAGPGALVWGGLMQQPRWSVSSSTSATSRVLTVQCNETGRYFGQREQAADYSAPPYSSITGTGSPMAIWGAASNANTWDPTLIGAQLLADALGYAQTAAITNGNPLGGITVAVNGFNAATNVAGYLASGTNTPQADYISVTYPYESLQYVDAMLGQLGKLGYGISFDYGYDPAYVHVGSPSSGALVVANLSYPRRGRTSAANGLVLDLSQASAYNFSPDGTQQGWTQYGTGGSGGIVVDQNLAPPSQNYALFEQVNNYGQLLSGNLLQQLTNVLYGQLFLASYPPVTASVTMRPGQGPVLGSFVTGDDVTVQMPAKAPDGQPFDRKFLAGISAEWRITAYKVTVGDEGANTLQFSLGQPPALTTTAPMI